MTRTRNEAGASNSVLGSVAMTIVVIAVFRFFGIDITGYLVAAADWLLAAAVSLGQLVFGEAPSTRH